MLRADTHDSSSRYTTQLCHVKEVDPQECLAPCNIILAQNQHPVTGEITYTVISSDYDLSACDHLENHPDYQYLGGECASTTPPFPLPAGIRISDVAPDGCFVMRHGYAGLTGVEDDSECELFETDPVCTFQREGACLQSFNLDSHSQLVCIEQEKHYLCRTAESIEHTVLNCAGQKFCINGNCFDTGHEPDTDFAQTMSQVEATREAGVYLNENTLRICCYNSRLGRIINTQGRAQIGKRWGSARNPSCGGFTQAEFASIDFAALDLSEFSREVMAAVKLPNVSDLSINAQDVITRRMQSYYDTGNQIE